MKYYTLDVLIAKEGDKQASFYGAEGYANSLGEFAEEHEHLWKASDVVQYHVRESKEPVDEQIHADVA